MPSELSSALRHEKSHSSQRLEIFKQRTVIDKDVLSENNCQERHTRLLPSRSFTLDYIGIDLITTTFFLSFRSFDCTHIVG